MTRTSRAIVQTAPRTLALRELPIPEIGPDDALLRVEACGICGPDNATGQIVRDIIEEAQQVIESRYLEPSLEKQKA